MQQFTTTAKRPVLGVTFGPGGSWLFAGGSGGYDTWEQPRGKHFFQKSHATKYYYGCQADVWGSYVYVCDSVKGMRLLNPWSDEQGTVPGSVYEKHVVSLALTVAGDKLLLSRGGASNNRVECWNVRANGTMDSSWSLSDGKPISAAQHYYINEGKWFHNAVAWGKQDTQCVVHEERRTAHGYTPQDYVLVIRAADDGRLVSELGITQNHFGNNLAFAHDGTTVIAWNNTLLERWDVAAAQVTHTVPMPGRGQFYTALLHPTEPRFVTGSGDGQLRVWSATDLQLIASHKLGIGKLHSLALSPDGKWLAAGGNKGEVVVYELHARSGEIR